MKHLSHPTLRDYARGKVALTEKQAAHLASCSLCQPLLEAWRPLEDTDELKTFETGEFRRLLQEDERRELFSFSKAEGLAMAALLDHLFAELEDWEAGALSQELAHRLYERMGTFEGLRERVEASMGRGNLD